MRRLVTSVVVCLVCLAATPRPAEAWFWKWLDDLSGPQFTGFSLDVRFACSPQGKGAREDMLREVKRRLQSEQLVYQRKALTSNERAALFYRLAATLLGDAVKTVSLVSPGQAARQAGNAPSPRLDVIDAALTHAMFLRVAASSVSEGQLSTTLKDELFRTLHTVLDHWEAKSRELDWSDPKAVEDQESHFYKEATRWVNLATALELQGEKKVPADDELRRLLTEHDPAPTNEAAPTDETASIEQKQEQVSVLGGGGVSTSSAASTSMK